MLVGLLLPCATFFLCHLHRLELPNLGPSFHGFITVFDVQNSSILSTRVAAHTRLTKRPSHELLWLLKQIEKKTAYLFTCLSKQIRVPNVDLIGTRNAP